MKASQQQVEDALRKTGILAKCAINEIPAESIREYRCGSGFILRHYFNTQTVLLQGKDEVARLKFEEAIKQQGSPIQIFVIYGHDKAARAETELLIHNFGLKPVVLEDCASGGKTLIEKLEYYLSPSDFVCALLTPDDQGGVINGSSDLMKPRARQNVILELGWAFGKLGRRRVAIIRRKCVDIPFEAATDLGGLVYIEYNESIKEIAPRLARELEGAGFSIDRSHL